MLLSTMWEGLMTGTPPLMSRHRLTRELFRMGRLRIESQASRNRLTCQCAGTSQPRYARILHQGVGVQALVTAWEMVAMLSDSRAMSFSCSAIRESIFGDFAVEEIRCCILFLDRGQRKPKGCNVWHVDCVVSRPNHEPRKPPRIARKDIQQEAGGAKMGRIPSLRSPA